ncbi:ShTK domain-containing family protein [Salix suchowensis]|nr:ShTK domain-containing family protein [Salix suchowensis]
MASFVYLLLFMVLTLTAQFSLCFGKTSRKELRNTEPHLETMIQSGSSIQINRVDPSRVVTVSWRPRVFMYNGFLTDEECDHLISLAQGTKETSEGKDDDSGRTGRNRLLASSTSLLNMDDNILSRIEERVSAWTLLPKENSKPLQVMHYGIEDAKNNVDYFGNKSAIVSSEPLMATLVFYLSNVTQGGEILFPKSEVKSKIWSDCTKISDSLRPIKGNAILFFTVHPNSSPDMGSSHSRCPVLEGEMWYATKTFYLRAIKVFSDSEGSECTDEDGNCSSWAALGECEKNPVYMIGSPDYYGTCRRSCNAC